MVEIVKLDRYHPHWCSNNRVNEAYVIDKIDYTRETLAAKGSMYMSKILEIFGGELYPGDSDYIVKDERGVCYSYQLMDDDTWIKISIYY